MTVREVADRLEVGIETVYALIHSGRLRAYRHGIGRGTYRIYHNYMPAYLRSSQVRPVSSRAPAATANSAAGSLAARSRAWRDRLAALKARS